ncbi:hypothetical protein [Streptomyces liangshanensis]|uniref:hypothetical protein n=1 Tax=Streptomyces liangshanensis TaxID=2717324 RepID=UPI0036D90A72
MTGWIKSGVLAWVEGTRYDDETVLVYFKGVDRGFVRDGLIAVRRPPFACGGDVGGGEWGVVVHPMYDPARDDYDLIDHRKLCPPGAELVVFVPNPCVAKAHGPQAYHYRDGRTVSCVDYEAPTDVGEYWPNELAAVITAAGPDPEDLDKEEQLTRLISDHFGLPPLDRGSLAVDRDLVAAHEG